MEINGVKLEFVDQSVSAFTKGLVKDENGQRFLVTPNPEILLTALENKSFAEVLGRADYLLPDSFGLTWAFWWEKSNLAKMQKVWRYLFCYPSLAYYWLLVGKTKKVKRITGVDFLEHVLVNYFKEPIFLLGAAPGVAEKVVKEYSYANVVGVFAGSPADSAAKDIVNRINASGAKWLFVAYGAPKQEFWLDKYLSELKSVKIAVGVGGAFDFLAKEVNRAPMFVRRVGLEWCWRLVLQPSRWRRIYSAFVRFPLWVVGR